MIRDIAEGVVNGLATIGQLLEDHPWLGWIAAVGWAGSMLSTGCR